MNLKDCDHILGVYSHREDGDLSMIRLSKINAEGGMEVFENYLNEWAAGVKWFKYCPECGEKL